MTHPLLEDFIKETAIKKNHFWIMIDTGIDITQVPDDIIFQKMDSLVKTASDKNLKIHMVVDAKRINPLRFDVKKFTRIQTYFAKQHNQHVDKIFIINANTVFKGIQALITPFLDKSYTNKITYPNTK